MTPLSNQILIKPSTKVEKVGSIVLATTAQEDNNTGKVIAVGPGKTAKDGVTIIPLTVSNGDEVLYVPGKVVPVMFKKERHYLISEDDILAIM